MTYQMCDSSRMKPDVMALEGDVWVLIPALCLNSSKEVKNLFLPLENGDNDRVTS